MSQDEDEGRKVSEKMQDDTKPGEKRSRFDFLRKVSVEPCVFLCGLGYSLIGVEVSTLYIQKTCKVGSYFFGNETFSIEVTFANISIGSENSFS